jgi:hypothetical protein
MEVKTDKRTKAYKDSIEKAKKYDVEGFPPAEDRHGLVIEEEPGYTFIPCLECGGSGKGDGCMEQGGFVKGLCPECCGHKGTMKENKEMIGNPEQKVVTPKPKPDLLHCPGCGAELLEDERNTKSPAFCRECIWRNA